MRQEVEGKKNIPQMSFHQPSNTMDTTHCHCQCQVNHIEVFNVTFQAPSNSTHDLLIYSSVTKMLTSEVEKPIWKVRFRPDVSQENNVVVSKKGVFIFPRLLEPVQSDLDAA